MIIVWVSEVGNAIFFFILLFHIDTRISWKNRNRTTKELAALLKSNSPAHLISMCQSWCDEMNLINNYKRRGLLLEVWNQHQLRVEFTNLCYIVWQRTMIFEERSTTCMRGCTWMRDSGKHVGSRMNWLIKLKDTCVRLTERLIN